MAQSFDINDDKKLGIIDNYKQIKSERQERDNNLALYATKPPNITNLKLYVETILQLPDYEEILYTIVEDLNRTEQMALNDESKISIYWEKRLLGFVFTHCQAFGDQYSVVQELARQLGYHKITY